MVSLKSNENLDISNLNKLIFKSNANLYIFGNLINTQNKKSIWEVDGGLAQFY